MVNDDIRKAQADFARTQIGREHQSADDRAEIKIKLIENGILVKMGQMGWYTFEDWPKASAHISARLDALRAKRQGA